ncbi:SPOR domain-containing protein [Sulfurovum sp. zt1-1]|uniref:SPOR domain-containing protein n=1 Tax=Sulfurovum zhangzhouensis TaxID=3019067 RepID=A0ABT7R0Q2_9BACT|nr:SPOR domain-containing protein [Sulfurovum zhangzhouensis]MDM5272675.1 SPOR domain-containing protein [Sulfurovum zhangzhouensis]
MNDHNLDDLIIDDIQPKQANKAKSFLTIIALAIVVLIVSIIFTKILLKAPKQDQLLFEQNEIEMISPDLTLQSVTGPEDKTSTPLEVTEDENRVQITKETTTPKITEEVPAPMSEITDKPEKSTNVELPKSEEQPEEVAVHKQVEVEKELTPAPMPEPEEEKPTDILNIVEQPAENSIHPTSEVSKQKVQNRTEQIVEEQRVEKYRPANVITRPAENYTKAIHHGNYYIQVGAFSNDPSQHFLNRITSNGFTYIITKRSPKGYKKLLIGPYSDQKSAEDALVRVKALINKRAFLLNKK